MLAGGYLYEDFYAAPAAGPTSGGTVVHFIGQGTAWAAGTTVTIDEKPCEPVAIVSPTELTCTSPANAPGAKSVAITTADKVSVVRDGIHVRRQRRRFQRRTLGREAGRTPQGPGLRRLLGCAHPRRVRSGRRRCRHRAREVHQRIGRCGVRRSRARPEAVDHHRSQVLRADHVHRRAGRRADRVHVTGTVARLRFGGRSSVGGRSWHRAVDGSRRAGVGRRRRVSQRRLAQRSVAGGSQREARRLRVSPLFRSRAATSVCPTHRKR